MGMSLQERLGLLTQLGEYLQSDDERLMAYVQRTFYHNPWFTPDNQRKAMKAIAREMLSPEKLQEWIQPYQLPEVLPSEKTIGMVMAGNLPLVGFQDVLCVFVSGHRTLVKLSEKDKYLLPHLISWLEERDERVKGRVVFSERLNGFDAVIATGSNNAYRYFEAYFGKKPGILRKNRNSVAILSGQESPAALHALGQDIFAYFGLGCRNVSKIYVPRGYNFEPLLEALHEFRDIVLHEKYKHNFDYNYALFVLNRAEFLNTGSLILQENPSLLSRIACLHYEYYDSQEDLAASLHAHREDIQCLVAGQPFDSWNTLAFGTTQQPGLHDYPDGVDVMQFLRTMSLP